MAILPREILYPQSSSSGHAHVLKEAVVDKRRGHAVRRAEHEEKAAISSRLDAMLVLPLLAFISRPTHDIREHARNDKPVPLGAAGHNRPTVITLRTLTRQIDIEASHGRRIAPDDFLLRLLERLQCHGHCQHFLNIIVL